MDDAIVMLENIVRHMEEGKGRMEAALMGSREIGFTIVSMTLSLAAVFIPVLFMGGVIGRLLHEFAVVIGVAVLVSGFVSLTLTPMACSRFLRHSRASPRPPLQRCPSASSTACSTCTSARSSSCSATRMLTGVVFLAHRWWPTGYLFMVIPKGFIPNEDTGQIFAFTEAAQDISFDAMMDKQQQVAAIAREEPVRRRRSSRASGPAARARC